MELVTPSLGLIIWTIVCFVSLVLMVYAIYRLGNNDSISISQKLLWAIVIVFVPLFGAILYLKTFRKNHAKVLS